MKKVLKVIIGLVCISCIIGGVKNVVKDDKKSEIVSVNSNSDTKNSKKEISKDESESEAEQVATIEEQVLWEVDGLKITATGIDRDSIWGTKLNILIENNSDKDVGIGADALIVNDYMINDLFATSVTAGNKTNDSITLFSSELKAAGIENIGKIELYLHTYDTNTFSTQKSSDCITITTSETVDETNNINGTTLFEKDGIKIVGQYVDENSFWGAAVLLYIENNSDQNVRVNCDDVAINGYMVSALGSHKVYAGKKAISDITLLSSDLEKNGITSIDEVETEFRITNDDYKEIANSGKVKFSTK